MLKVNLIKDRNSRGKSKGRSVMTRDISKIRSLPELLIPLQAHLEALSDPQLLELAAAARHLEWCAFILRGMCVSELRQRYTKRLAGGRGKRDQKGVGIQAQLAKLAARIGVAKSTAITDGRIYEKFFSQTAANGGQRLLDRDKCLPREYYVMALSTTDPWGVINTTLVKRAEGGYSRQRFRSDLSSMSKVAEVVPPNLYSIHVSISPEAQHSLSEIIKVAHETTDEIISNALIVLYQIRFPALISLLDSELVSDI
jgi:hypothetical protein